MTERTNYLLLLSLIMLIVQGCNEIGDAKLPSVEDGKNISSPVDEESSEDDSDDNSTDDTLPEDEPEDDSDGDIPPDEEAGFSIDWKNYCGAHFSGEDNLCGARREAYRNLVGSRSGITGEKDLVVNLGMAPFYGSRADEIDWGDFLASLQVDGGAAQANAAEEFADQVIAWEQQYGINIYVQVGNEIMVGHGSPVDEQSENLTKDKYGELCLALGTQSDPDCRPKAYANYIFEPVHRGLARAGVKIMMGSVSNLRSSAKQQVFETILRTELGQNGLGLNPNIAGKKVHELVGYTSGHYIQGNLDEIEKVFDLTNSLGIKGHFQTEEAGRQAVEVDQANSGASAFIRLFTSYINFAFERRLTPDQFRFMTWGSRLSSEGSRVVDATKILNDELGSNKITATKRIQDTAQGIWVKAGKKELVTQIGERNSTFNISALIVETCEPSSAKVHVFGPGFYELVDVVSIAGGQLTLAKTVTLQSHHESILVSVDCK